MILVVTLFCLAYICLTAAVCTSLRDATLALESAYPLTEPPCLSLLGA